MARPASDRGMLLSDADTALLLHTIAFYMTAQTSHVGVLCDSNERRVRSAVPRTQPAFNFLLMASPTVHPMLLNIAHIERVVDPGASEAVRQNERGLFSGLRDHWTQWN